MASLKSTVKESHYNIPEYIHTERALRQGWRTIYAFLLLWQPLFYTRISKGALILNFY